MSKVQDNARPRHDRGGSVLVVEDHPIVVAGIRRLLIDAGWPAIDHTSSFADAFRRCRQARPAAIVVDLSMVAGSLAGISFVRRLRRYDADVPILVLTMHDDPRIARATLKAGANGYVVKDSSPAEIVKGLVAVLNDKPYVSRVLASDLAFFKGRQPEESAIGSLSSRERQVLSMLAEGKSYTQIADNLAISYKSVAHICGRLKPKLGLQSLPELVSFAMHHLPSARSTLRIGTKTSKDKG